MADRHFWLIICILILPAMTLGCGGSSNAIVPGPPPPPPRAEFLYTVALSGSLSSPSFQLSSFKIDSATGGLSAGSSIPLPQILPAGVAVDSEAKFLYLSAPSPGANAIDIFSLNPTTGAPSPAGGFLLTQVCAFCPPESGPGALVLDSGGKFLYYGSSTLGGGVVQGVGALSADSSTGGLSLVPGSPFPADQIPIFLAAHPSGKFIYTEDASGIGAGGFILQGVSGFSVDSNTGALAPVSGSPFASPATADIAGCAIHPSGKFLYASTGLAADGVLAWSIDGTTGKLTVLPGAPFEPGATFFGAAFDPAGKFLYVSAGAPGGISGFSVDSNSGMLVPLSGSPFSSGSALLGPVIDPSGQFLFAVDGQNDAITGFRVDATTGMLTALGRSTPVGFHPSSLTIVQAP